MELLCWSYSAKIVISFAYLINKIFNFGGPSLFACGECYDHGTWCPMDEDMYTLDVLKFHSEDEPYMDHITSCQIDTGLTDAIQQA